MRQTPCDPLQGLTFGRGPLLLHEQVNSVRDSLGIFKWNYLISDC